MGILASIVVYILVWWMVFLCALPWGFEAQKNHVTGTPVSAPENPRIKLKMLITTLLSVVIWGIIYIMVEMKVVDFREMASQMPR